MTEKLYITATDVKSVKIGGDSIVAPLQDERTSDCGLPKVDLEGHKMTCLVMYGIAGDAEVLIDVKRGITYELHTPDIFTEEEVYGSVEDSLPSNVR